MNNTKRTYKHSEAWIAKHADKIKVTHKKEAKNSSKQKKEVKRVLLKKSAKKDVKNIVKMSSEDKKLLKAKKLEAKKAARIAKKAAKEERKVKNALKKSCKDMLKNANKLFNSSKKSISTVKKCTKAYGKLLTETYKLGDAKTLNKITKIFARLGYEIDDGNISTGMVENTFIANFKLPKVKAAKIVDNSVENKNTTPSAEHVNDNTKANAEVSETPAEQTPREIIVEMQPSDNENVNEDDENDLVPLADDGIESDEYEDERVIEDSDFEDTSRNIDSLFDSSDLRDSSESLREMEEAQRENGDWEA